MINTTTLHGIKAIFFDLHGVLVDTEDWHRVALLSALQDFGYEVPIPRNHKVWGIYGGTLKQLEYLAKIEWIDEDAIKLIHGYKQIYTRKIIRKRCNRIPKVIDVMEYAKSAGFRLAVVTNGNRTNAEMMLKASGLYDYFEFIITREDVDGDVKPSPRPYLEARYRMGLERKEALVIDDTEKGIMSAVDACCRTWRLKSIDDLSVRNLMGVISNYTCTL